MPEWYLLVFSILSVHAVSSTRIHVLLSCLVHLLQLDHHFQQYGQQTPRNEYQRQRTDDSIGSPAIVPIRCPDQYIGARPYAGDCRRFVYCWNGVGRVESCTPKHTFDTRLKQCQTPPNGIVDCRQSTTDDDTSCFFDCQLHGVCLTEDKMCNGVDDCGNQLDEVNCPNDAQFSLHLVATDNTLDNNNGVLKVKLGTEYGVICDTGFGIREAMVACRELGFRLGAKRVGRIGKSSSMGNESASIKDTDTLHRYHMDQVSCRGDELSLAACYHSGWGSVSAQCMASGLASAVTVECKRSPALRCRRDFWLCEQQNLCIHYNLLCDGQTDCDDGSDESSHICDAPMEYRITSNNSRSDGVELREGRVEVRYKGVWGAVCDTQFGRREATVFCRSLGYVRGKVHTIDSMCSLYIDCSNILSLIHR